MPQLTAKQVSGGLVDGEKSFARLARLCAVVAERKRDMDYSARISRHGRPCRTTVRLYRTSVRQLAWEVIVMADRVRGTIK